MHLQFAYEFLIIRFWIIKKIPRCSIVDTVWISIAPGGVMTRPYSGLYKYKKQR